MQVSLFQICIRDISFSYKIEISTFKIEISVFQLQIHVSVFKTKNRCLYLKHRYIYLKYRYLYFKCGERGGSVVECRTPEREVRGSRPTAAVLCP